MVPSEIALHFMRIRPDSSSFFIQVRTSTCSPGLSFLSLSLIFWDFSFDSASISKDSVKRVSLTTLKMPPPSSRYWVPWLPEMVTNPSTPSFMARLFTRITSTSLSDTGLPKSSRTSPGSSCRTTLLSLMLTPSVITVFLATFLKFRKISVILSLFSTPALDSSQTANTRRRASDEGVSPFSAFFSAPSAFFSLASLKHFSKKETKLASSTAGSSPFEDICSKRASLLRSLSFWYCFSTSKACLCTFTSSFLSF
mmetsp:Transcript_81436/g.143807  ORF Transcript_81436/g.143807 Transcript_81436/m.143807 type:complete len:254 (-) Transcript_81436:2027-2788(-)